jgi:hypothetical protein
MAFEFPSSFIHFLPIDRRRKIRDVNRSWCQVADTGIYKQAYFLNINRC